MIEVVLPWPNGMLSPNSRAHWARKARQTKEHRRTAWIETHAQTNPVNLVSLRGVQRLGVHYKFAPPDRRPRDDDNMVSSCKAYRDGISDALDVNDSKFVTSHEIIDPVRGGAVFVYIKELPC